MAFRSSAEAAELAGIIATIHAQWEQVLRPEADPARWDRELHSAFAGHTVVNWTDFNYGKCHSYEIFLQAGPLAAPESAAEEAALIERLGGQRDSLLLKLSVVAPYFLLRPLRRKLDASRQLVERPIVLDGPEHAPLLERARRFAIERGYRPITATLLEHLIPGVELELAEPGTVTVYNCLFEDQANIAPLVFAEP